MDWTHEHREQMLEFIEHTFGMLPKDCKSLRIAMDLLKYEYIVYERESNRKNAKRMFFPTIKGRDALQIALWRYDDALQIEQWKCNKNGVDARA